MRFGLLGTGHWAAETQAAALSAHPDVDFVGVWGRSPAAVVTLAQRYGVTAFADVDELLGEVDAIAVALPPDVQATLALRAAAAGKHLLLDKPLALATGPADELVAEVGARGLASIVFFTRRFNPGIEVALTGAAANGGWDGARSTFFARIFDEGNPYRASAWRRQWGGLWDVGPHALSLVLPVLGPVTDVRAMAGPHASTHVLARHASGAVSTLALTLAAPAAAVWQETEFYGASGRLIVPAPDLTAVAAFGAAVGELVALAIAAGSAGGVPEHRCDVRFGRDVVAVLAAADRARADGTAVTIGRG